MGPLAGVRVVELGGMGPTPFCAMLLADLGAEVVRVDRPGEVGGAVNDRVLRRGRRSIAVDLKQQDGLDLLLRLVERSDVLLEGFRPGVAERLGFGPDECLARNPRLVYGRMTGWGQEGPMAQVAGHDVNYIALSGVLGALGRADAPPAPPLALLGDFGGGGMLLAFGIAAALVQRATSGAGQVIDAAMVDGSALLMSMFFGLHSLGAWEDRREANLLDGGAYFYDTYRTKDDLYLAVGAIEPQFHAQLVAGLGLDAGDFEGQADRDQWAQRKKAVADAVAARTRDEWAEAFGDSDACVAPVLTLAEAPQHPHNASRGTFVTVDGVVQAAPAPRFSTTPCATPSGWARPGAATAEIATELGVGAAELDRLVDAGVLRIADEGSA
jgi:alpha-methylacyl-CoA racemase